MFVWGWRVSSCGDRQCTPALPIAPNWCKERESKQLPDLGCESSFTLKMDSPVLLRGRQRREGKPGKGWPCSRLRSTPLHSHLLLTSSIKAWSFAVPAEVPPVYLPMVAEERACPAPASRWGFVWLELKHFTSECMKSKVTCWQLLLTLGVFYMAI